ncbi:MAG: hypothetical protein WA030_02855 [Candidatus Microsaccharimonas sp.]
MQKTQQPKKTMSAGKIVLVIALSLLMLPVVIGITMASLNRSTNEDRSTVPTPNLKTTYEVKIVGNTYADKSNRRLTFTITNTGNVAGNPACSITVDTPEGFSPYSYGQDYVTWNSILNPGEQKYFEGLITISNESASNATHANISCS